MKKFFVLTAILAALFLAVSCGSDSDGDEEGNVFCETKTQNKCGGKEVSTCTEGNEAYYKVDGKKFQCKSIDECEDATAELKEYCSKNGGTVEEPDEDKNGDNGDGQGDSTTDENGDSGTSSEFPECSVTSEFPCIDSENRLVWSEKSEEKMDWNKAVLYCTELADNDLNWSLPTISELRTLIKNCKEAQTGGACAVQDPDHLAEADSDENCSCEEKQDNGGYYSKLGDDDNIWLWSSSQCSDAQDSAWSIGFAKASVETFGIVRDNFVRCVVR